MIAISTFRLFVATALAGVLFSTTPRAVADDKAGTSKQSREAEDLREQGNVAYKEKRYADALAAYERSYTLDPDPRVLFNQGRALAALARYPEALSALETFAREAPDKVKGQVPELDVLIADLKKRVTRLRIRSSVTGARVLLRNRQIGVTPLKGATVVNAGAATLDIVASGYRPYKKKLDLPGGGDLTHDAELMPIDVRATLRIESPITGARVVVDGRTVGTVPAETQVAPGSHAIVVTHPDYENAETSAVVRAGEVKRLSIALDSGTPITGRWWFWTGVGVVVVGTVITIVALNTEKEASKGDIPPGQLPVPLVRF